MRGFILKSALLAAVAVSDSINKKPLPLEQAYGTVEPIDELDRWADREDSKSGQRYAEDYFEIRRRDNCVFPLEVVIVQDATGSFRDDFKQLKEKQLPAMFEALKSTHPGSKFGLVSFRDKPIPTLGYSSDFCQRFEVDLTSNTQTLINKYGRLVASGGFDAPENQLGALIAGAQSSEIGWTHNEPLRATKLLVMVTDSQPHFGDDGYNKPYYHFKPFSGVWDEDKPTKQCVTEYYPVPQHVKDALENRQAYLATLIYDADSMNGLPRRSWNWLNSYIGQTDAFVNSLAENSSDFWVKLSKIITELEAVECPVETTVPPTTTPRTESSTPSENGETTTEGECKCPPEGQCPCQPDAVVIRLKHRPQKLRLEVENFDASETA